jgi:hypothetical protein
MPELTIKVVTSSSSQIEYNYLDSEFLFGISLVGTYKVNINDVSFVQDSTSPILEGIEALNSVYEKQNLIARIGFDEYTNGKVTSISYEESTLSAEIIATIVIEQRIAVDSNDILPCLIIKPEFLESFSESYSFNRTDDSYSFDRKINIKWKYDIGPDFIQNARQTINNFFEKRRPNFGFQTETISENGRFNEGFKTNKTEEIDLINLSISLSENFSSSSINNNISKSVNYSISINELGFTEEEYTIDLQALREPLEFNIVEAVKNEINARIGATKPLSIEKGLNKDGGKATLKITFTNDPTKNQTVQTTYDASSSKESLYEEYKLSVNHKADGKTFESSKSLALNAYQTFGSQYASKIQNLLSTNGSEVEKSRSTTFVKNGFRFSISDEITYSKNPVYSVGTQGLLKQATIESSQEPQEQLEKINSIVTKKQYISTKEIFGTSSRTEQTEAIAWKSLGFLGAYKLINADDDAPANAISDSLDINLSEGRTTRVISFEEP